MFQRCLRKSSQAARAAARALRTSTGPVCNSLERRVLLAVGQLDPAFGNDGIVVADLGGPDQATDVLVRADGKIVVSARSGTQSYLLRYSSDGSVDTTF